MAYEMAGECQVCGKVHKVGTNGLVARHAADVQWLNAPEFCAGSGHKPYEHECNVLAEHRADVLVQASTLAMEHLNTAVTENVDPHGRSWCRVQVIGNAFNGGRGGVQWVLGRIMQTETGVVQVLDGVGHLHVLPAYKTVRAARRAMLEFRLATLDEWHVAATERAEWLKLRLEQWAPRKLRRWTTIERKRAPRTAHHA